MVKHGAGQNGEAIAEGYYMARSQVLSDQLLNFCKGQGNAVRLLLGKVRTQRGKAGVGRYIPLLEGLCDRGPFNVWRSRQFHQTDEVEIHIDTLLTLIAAIALALMDNYLSSPW